MSDEFALTGRGGRTVGMSEVASELRQAGMHGTASDMLTDLGAPVSITGSLASVSNYALKHLFMALDTLGIIDDNTS